MIQATSYGNIDFSTSFFSDLYEQVIRRKYQDLWFIANPIKGKGETLFEEPTGNSIYKNTW